MEDNEWDELLELRGKARLSPKTDHRFTRLEDYIADTDYLAGYDEKELGRLLVAFNKLSDQERQALLNRARNRTHANSFHLSHEETEKLQAARKKMSFHERARLLILKLTTAGTALLDLGEVFEAIILIDNKSSPERETRPYAHICFSDGYQRQVETIDIIETVKNDPTAIGHPAIAFAIHHWQQVIYAMRVIDRDDITYKDKDRWGQYFKDEYRGGKELRSAKSNLKSISQPLYNAAKERSIPLESAFALKMQWCGLLQSNTGNGSSGDEEKRTVVYKAWEELKAFVGEPIELEEILGKLAPKLDAYERVMEGFTQPISAHRVMEFLKDEGEKGGRRFVGFNEDGKSLRIRWVVFRNAFAAWYFELDQSSTVTTYLKKARKQSVVDDDVYKPTMAFPNTTVDRFLTKLLTKQLVAVRSPVSIPESDIGIGGIEKAIEESAYKIK